MWKVDTTKTGVEQVFKPYQMETIKTLIDRQKGIKTLDIHAHLDFEGFKASRATVINYLKKLDKCGFLSRTEESGKGGYHSVYTVEMTFEELVKMITNDVLKSLSSAFPENEWLKNIYIQIL